jgi:hypothetical protein
MNLIEWAEIIVPIWILLSAPLGFFFGLFVAAGNKEDGHDIS